MRVLVPDASGASLASKQFIAFLLQLDAERRPSARDLIDHPLLRQIIDHESDNQVPVPDFFVSRLGTRNLSNMPQTFSSFSRWLWPQPIAWITRREWSVGFPVVPSIHHKIAHQPPLRGSCRIGDRMRGPQRRQRDFDGLPLSLIAQRRTLSSGLNITSSSLRLFGPRRLLGKRKCQ
jgi:hypothetical protein